MTHGELAVALLLPAPLLACAQYYRPDHPLRGSDGPTSVEVQKVIFRPSDVEVSLSDPHPTATIDGAWIFATGSPDGGPCARKATAKTIQQGGRGDAGATYTAHFQTSLADLLQYPSTLEVHVAGREEPPGCLSIPISGDTPDLAWTLEPWGKNRMFAGVGGKFWIPVRSSDRYGFAADWTIFRLGRWWGPLRLGAGAGIGFSSGSGPNPNGAFVVPVSLAAETFPLVRSRLALGLGASYDVRPSDFHDGGFELIHGPSANVELAYLPGGLPGFTSGPRAGTVGLALSVGRWLPYGGATVMGVALSVN